MILNRIFLVAAVVLIVFALVAAASAGMRCLGSPFGVWLAASLLAYYADLLLAPWLGVVWDDRSGRRRPVSGPTPPA